MSACPGTVHCESRSDSYGVHPLVLAVGGHYQGKNETVALERNNSQQLHWTAALRRRSIVVSKSITMIERRASLFAHLLPTRRLFLRCTGCRSRLMGSSQSIKMQHYSVKPSSVQRHTTAL
jgi:hypothetical protein